MFKNTLAAMALAIVAPVAACVMQMALSRSREFEADQLDPELAGGPHPHADRDTHRCARRKPHCADWQRSGWNELVDNGSMHPLKVVWQQASAVMVLIGHHQIAGLINALSHHPETE